MKNFGISELQRYSGVKAHTLRTWEMRYGLPKPDRNKGNLRRYSLPEVKLILQIAALNINGYKISHLSALSIEQITERLKQLKGNDNLQRIALINLLVSMHALDIEEFENILDHCFTCWPAYTVLTEVIYPFLRLTNLFWQGTRSTEEHLVVTVIRKKLIYAIETVNASDKIERKVLLFLPDTRQLDLALLYACYNLAYAGIKVIYLGNDISFENIAATILNKKPNYIYTYLPVKNNFQFSEIAHMITALSPDTSMLVTLQPEASECQFINDRITSISFDQALQFLTCINEGSKSFV